ncbi:hypothetical protein FBUS_05637 [Fasciolopsis buskii]|uniref:Uncharacterized protein n=1 Tax=Fasciolopsis buskii TaxID=27845 RepID=A0A8E0S0J4_9TREM|nr:hypothetical protein FBUS_05637 [Fasciolopsis buski]
MAGYDYPEPYGDILLKLDDLHELPSYQCYTCTDCKEFSSEKTRIEKDCNECVIILKSSGLPDRECSHKEITVCRENFQARCCQGDLCNRGRRPYSRTQLLSVSFATVLFMQYF